MDNVFFSIITVSLNVENKIKDTINSVLNQTFSNYEIIVKDGLSKDDTLKNIPSSDKIKVYSEKDTSVYNAMNQAINYASGKYLLFLNCGDSLAKNDVLEKVAKEIERDNFVADMYYGDRIVSNNTVYQTENLNKAYLLHKGGLCHQSVFFKRKLFEEIGLYDERFLLCADYEYFCRVIFKGKSVKHFPITVCNYELGGISSVNVSAVNKEGRKIKRIYFGISGLLKYDFYRIVNKFRRNKNGV